MSNKELEKQLKEPDLFIKAVRKSWLEVETVLKPLMILVTLGLIVGVCFVAYNWMQARHEREAARALQKDGMAYTKLKEDFEKSRYNSLLESVNKDKSKPDPKAKEDSKLKVATGDVEKDFGSVIPGMKKVLADFPHSNAAIQAGLYLSDIFLEYKQFDQALDVAQKISSAKNLDAKDPLHAMAAMNLGNVLSAKGQCAEAIPVFQKLSQSDKATFLHGDAMLKLAVCYESTQQFDLAIQTYKKIAEGPAEEVKREAKNYLRALEVRRSLKGN